MTLFSLRRAVLVAACASAALLAACGSGTTESAITPSRFISFGDAFSDVGQTGTKYTVNDGAVNNWVVQLSSSFGVPVTASSAGGLAYGRANARVVAKPDAVGNNATLTVKEQIDAFLASNTLGPNDVTVVSGGISDIVAQMAAVNAGTQTEAQMTANLQQAGRDLGEQVRRVVAAGGKQVVVVGPYNLGRSPWAIQTGKVDLLTDVSSKFNEAMLVSIVDLGKTVLYVDAAYYLNLVTGTPAGYALTNSTDLACTSVDAGLGIGTGAGQVNSALCTTGTIAAGVAYDQYAFADRLYFTPIVNRLFGTYAYDKVRDRW